MRRRSRRLVRVEHVESRVLLSGSYHLTYDDEFNTLNLATGPTSGGWLSTDYYTSPYLNNEKEYYALQAGSKFTDAYNPFSVSNGVLSITAQPNKDANGNPIVTTTKNPKYPNDTQPYLSGMLTTAKGYPSSTYPQSLGFAQQYGYFEIRAQLPNAQGMWPAFWLMPADGSSTAEYDVFEVPINTTSTDRTPTDIYQTLHWGGYSDWHTNSQGFDYDKGVNTSTGFHTFGLEWTPKTVNWYVDGVLTQTQVNRSDKPMYMLMNLAVGGSWPGDPTSSNVWPQSMKVDYVRVYSLDTNQPALTVPTGASLPTGVGTLDAAGTVYKGLRNGSFETSFTTNGYKSNPTGALWTFSGTGITSTGTNGLTGTPDGITAAALVTTGTITQTFTTQATTSGTYTVTFKAMNRSGTPTQSVRLLIDGVLKQTFTPTTAFAAYTSNTFTLSAGSHTIQFKGTATGANATAYLDDVAINATKVGTVTVGTPTLSATVGTTEGVATLSWTTVANASAYVLERKAGSNAYKQLAQLTGTSYTDTGLSTEPGVGAYKYRIRAIVGAAPGKASNEVTVTPLAQPPATPSNFAAALNSSYKPQLTWLLQSYYGKQIRIERKTGSGGTYAQVASISNTDNWVDTTAANGTTYYYRVRVYDPQNASYSAYTLEKSVTVPAGGTVLFDEGLKNGFTYFGSGSTTVGAVSSPVHSGTQAFGATSTTTYAQIGVKSGANNPPILAGQTTLEFAVYITGATKVSSFMVQLNAPTYRTIAFNNANNSLWTLDGQAGTTTLTSGWHIVRINLAAAFGSDLVPGTTKLLGVTVQTAATGTNVYLDDMKLTS